MDLRYEDDPLGGVDVLPRRRHVTQRDGPRVDAQRTAGDRLDDRGQLGQDVASGYRTLATTYYLQRQCPQRGGRDFGSRAGDRADLDPGQRLTVVAAMGGDRDHRVGGGRSPQIVDDDVDIGGSRSEARAVAEGHDGICAEAWQARQPLRVAAGRHDPARAELFGDLHGDLPGTTGGAENQHGLAGLKVGPAPQRDPG